MLGSRFYQWYYVIHVNVYTLEMGESKCDISFI